jgi:glycosyltransferase involved in cell wall biosynthesis
MGCFSFHETANLSPGEGGAFVTNDEEYAERAGGVSGVQAGPRVDAALVDVGIPTYGRPAYVREAIESVLAQTWTAWRLVISEDGPGGGAVAAAVAPYLADPRITYVATGDRVGAARNMTRLINTGRAPYVALLHDDDRWAPSFLESHVNFLEEHRECGFVCSHSRHIDERGRYTGGGKRVKLPPGVVASEQVIYLMMESNIVPVASVVVRRSSYEAVGPAFDERFARIYDYEMWFRLAARFPVGHIPSWDAEWRKHGDQSTYKGRLRGPEQLLFLEHAEEIVRRELPHFEIPERRWRMIRSRRSISAALDALERSEVRRAFELFGQAIREHPIHIADPRIAVGLLALISGRPGRRVLGALRLGARRRGLRLRLDR